MLALSHTLHLALTSAYLLSDRMKVHIADSFTHWAKKNHIECEYHQSIDSTNDLAKKESSDSISDVKIYIADQQTAGRGRNQNSWANPRAGDSLMCSFSYALTEPPQAITGPLFGLNLFRAAKMSFSDLNFSLKAPNDLLLDSKKCAGLLIEAIQTGSKTRLIVGLGLNIYSAPENIPATYLAQSKVLNTNELEGYFANIHSHFLIAARGSYAAHLTEAERTDLLHALNLNDSILEKYTAVSPFADLFMGEKIISWKEL